MDPKKIFKGLGKSKIKLMIIGGVCSAAGSVLIGLAIFSLIFGPMISVVGYVQNAAASFGEWVSQTWEKAGNWFMGNGWYDDETAFQEAIKKQYNKYKSKGAVIQTSYIMATLEMKYLYTGEKMELGEDVEEELDENSNPVESDEAEESIPFGKMIPDMKKLMKHIVEKNSGSYKVSNENFLAYLRYGKWAKNVGVTNHTSTMRYVEMTEDELKNNASKYDGGFIVKTFENQFDNMGDIEKAEKVESIIEEIYSLAETLTDLEEQASGNLVCLGEYTDAGTADITLQDLNNVYVNLADCNCAQGSLESCNSWQYQNIPFKDYIMGVVWAESYSNNIEAVKAQMVATKSYTLGRIKSMGRKWHEVDGKYVIYMFNSVKDQVFVPIDAGGSINECASSGGITRPNVPAATPEVQALLSEAYDETFNHFIWDGSYFTGSYRNDFGSDCQPGTCFSQHYARKTTNQTYTQILGYHYSNFNLLDMSTKTIQVSSVSCPAIAGTGQIRLPIDEGLYTVTSPFGNRTSPGGVGSTNHRGIDLGATQGTPIYSVAPGKVIFSGLTEGYGKLVTTSHDVDADGTDDYYILYAHCSELLVSEGDNVSGGHLIAKVGSTGVSTGPHLHFEIRKGSNDSAYAVDPQPFLDDIKSGNSIFNEMIRTEKKYYNQGDYSHVAYCPGDSGGRGQATIQSSGCLPTSFAMIVAGLRDSTVTPDIVANNICSNYRHYRINGAGTNQNIMSDQSFLSQYSLHSTHVNSDYENQIRTALELEKMIIVNVRGGTFNPSGNGHFFVLSGLNGDGTVSVFDPGARQRTKSYSISEVTSNISTGIWIFE